MISNYERTCDEKLPWNTGDKYGGWKYGDKSKHKIPVIFVHGNGRDANDWIKHARYFSRMNGYEKGDLWSITFKNESSTHDQMASQLDNFVSNILSYTQSKRVTIIAHSLGVTGSRHWISKYNRYNWIHKFISIAGANHGIPFLDNIDETKFDSNIQSICEYLKPISSNNEKLKYLNNNLRNIKYYTIRGIYDNLYIRNLESPIIENAEENISLPLTHDGVRRNNISISLIYNISVER